MSMKCDAKVISEWRQSLISQNQNVGDNNLWPFSPLQNQYVVVVLLIHMVLTFMIIGFVLGKVLILI